MRELSLDYFRQLDGFIERLVTAAGPDVQVFLASDHGFTASTEIVRINAYLGRKGLRALEGVAAGRSRQAPRQQLVRLPRLEQDHRLLPHAVVQRHHHPRRAQSGRDRHCSPRLRGRSRAV